MRSLPLPWLTRKDGEIFPTDAELSRSLEQINEV